jgi:hypothetical protein
MRDLEFIGGFDVEELRMRHGPNAGTDLGHFWRGVSSFITRIVKKKILRDIWLSLNQGANGT